MVSSSEANNLESEFKAGPDRGLPGEIEGKREWFPYWNADLAPASLGDD